MPKLPLNQWEDIVEGFYNKYNGLKRWQDANYQFVCNNGYLQTFTGRRYVFKKKLNRDGIGIYNRPSVCNYPVQGTSTGDIVPLCMIHIYRGLQKHNIEAKIINQVHDSIVIDTPKENVDRVCQVCYTVFSGIPQYVKNYWGYNWEVPMAGECKSGYNWSSMKVVPHVIKGK